MTYLYDDSDINGGEQAVADEAEYRQRWGDVQAFEPCGDLPTLREMRRALKARGWGDTPGLDALIEGVRLPTVVEE